MQAASPTASRPRPATAVALAPRSVPAATAAEELPQSPFPGTPTAAPTLTAVASAPSALPAVVTATDPAPVTNTAPPSTPPPSQAQWPVTIIQAPRPVGFQAPSVYASSLTLTTYGYEQAFVPTEPGDSIYPYPRLDFSRVGGPEPRVYETVVLENGFVRVTILPALGGRIIGWYDKATGRQLLYQNPVIRPTGWGYRGWWLAAGGIEWAFPVEEHGLNEWRPWQVATSQNGGTVSVSVSDVDDRSGMRVGATISLQQYRAYLTLEPWAENPTATPQSYQLWLNAMLTLGDNRVSPNTHIVVPAGDVTIHSTADGGLPGAGSQISWPVYNGRDMSRYGNWFGYLGFFAPPVPFSGLYDPDAGMGIIRTHPIGWPYGTKFFGPATLSPSIWTDDGSDYIELWSGATGSFWASATLEPGQRVGWTERWYPIGSLGAPTAANLNGALRVTRNGDAVEIAAATTGYLEGRVVLVAGDSQTREWPITLVPGQVFQTMGNLQSAGAVTVAIEDVVGTVLLSTAVGP